jgi:preprotein translocase subunit SecA
MFEALTKLTKRLFGDANERELKKIQPLVDQINSLEPSWQKLSDEALAGKTAEFRERLDKGETLDDLLPEAFATVREAGRRVMGMRHYDCQLIGGIVLHQGKIAEMRTGEGKTLVGTLPVYLNALTGKGAHVVTVNDYLAERDAEWMRPLYNFLKMEVGVILSGERNDQIKRHAYTRDITYGTNNEFGFDYLRDNMKFSLDQQVQQRGHHFAIIDEVDSILIDEARTPLIISGPMNADVQLYTIIDAVIPMLQNDVDFIVDEKGRSVTLTDEGISAIEAKLGIDNLYDPHNMEVLHHVNQSLKAHYLFKRDKDYVVREGQVVIVDEFTGRLMAGRRWSDGLHQAVEAKEKVAVQQESQTYATITFQNYFRMYDKLAGMTGTAATEAAEFAEIYDLDTVVIPTNRPVARIDHDDIIYKTQMEKFAAAADQIAELHKKGQPVLVGTTSVERSEICSRLLQRRGIPHEVLNAKNHAREAMIVAQAGRLGAITISTNMAGRGTDIKLGGNPEVMAADECDPETDPEGYAAALARFEKQCAQEREEVLAAGGLFIVGTERHESRRVDNQLRGRSGRQGDPGGSRFYLSLEDELLRIFGSDKITVWMERMGLEDDEPIEHRWISSSVENAQRKVEGHHFNSRKNLLEYDDVMNYQRKGVYEIRNRALKGENIVEMVREAANNIVGDVMDDFLGEGLHPEHWNLDGMRSNLERVFEITYEESDEELRDFSREELRQRFLTDAQGSIDAVMARFRDAAEEAGEVDEEDPDSTFREYARMLLLQYTDNLWKDHLLALDRLRQGVGLRGYGQRNPLLEYKREALQMYMMMSAMRDEQLVSQLVRTQPQLAAAAAASANPKRTARQLVSGNFRPAGDVFGGGGAPAPAPAPVAPTPAAPAGPPPRPNPGEEARLFAHAYQIRRNDPCPCGSGNKYKKCCYEAGWEPPASAEAQGEVQSGPVASPEADEVAASLSETPPTAEASAPRPILGDEVSADPGQATADEAGADDDYASLYSPPSDDDTDATDPGAPPV